MIVCRSESEGYNASGEKTQCEVVKDELREILLEEELIAYDERRQEEKFSPETQGSREYNQRKTNFISANKKNTYNVLFKICYHFV